MKATRAGEEGKDLRDHAHSVGMINKVKRRKKGKDQKKT